MKRTRFQQRVVFFVEISCKTHLLARYPYNLEKGRFWHKLKWNRVFNSELYSLSTFDPKRIFKQDILMIWQKKVLNTKYCGTKFSTASCIPLRRFYPKRIFKKDILIILQREVLKTKWSGTLLSKPSCILLADLMQSAFFSKISL